MKTLDKVEIIELKLTTLNLKHYGRQKRVLGDWSFKFILSKDMTLCQFSQLSERIEVFFGSLIRLYKPRSNLVHIKYYIYIFYFNKYSIFSSVLLDFEVNIFIHFCNDKNV